MKKIFFAAALILLIGNASAISVDNLGIRVNVDGDGDASVRETYSLRFISIFEQEDFSQKAIENSSSISAWQADYEFFEMHFARTISDIQTSSITFDNDAQQLTFEYTLKERFATLKTQEQRSDFFEISDRELFAFNDSGTIVIPDNTQIEIVLPQNSQIDSQNLPDKAIIAGTSILLSGIQSNSLNISYRTLKPIAFSGNDFITGISNFGLFIAVILAVAAIIIYTKKEELENKIENYLVEHSEIKTRNPEEAIDLELE